MRHATTIALAGLAAALALAGCGGKSAATTTTISTADWANGLCTAVTTWKTSVDSAVTSATSSTPSKSTLQSAADDVKKATQTLVSTTKSLGTPNTKAGAQAKELVDQLGTSIAAEQQKIDTALSGASGVAGIIAAAPTVVSSLQAMGNDVTTTFHQLQKLDASGELKDAFDSASACTSLTGSS